jgi:3-oxoacyl-[acyl-carrier-protein] synthase II
MSHAVSAAESDARCPVVTGIGLITPLAAGREESWRGLLAGRRALRWLELPDDERHLWPNLPAGAPAFESPGSVDALTQLGRHDLVSLCDEPVISLAISASLEAVSDSGLDLANLDQDRVACVIGTSKGGVHSLFRSRLRQSVVDAEKSTEAEKRTDESEDSLWWHRVSPAGAATAVSSLFGIRGAVQTPVTACATGLSSLVQAAQLIRDGAFDVVLAGSSDASLTPAIVASFKKLGVLAKQFDDPQTAVQPFDRNRSGFLVGEGAAVFVLESAAHAAARRAATYADWLTAGMASDATGLTQLELQPDALIWLIRNVLRRSGVAVHELDYVSLHGTATRMNDVVEMRALQAALECPSDHLRASSIKGAIGHLLGAAGGVEFASMLLALRDGVAPPTMNLEHPESEFKLNLVPQIAQYGRIDYAMKLSLGFGGHLVAAIVRRGTRRAIDR